MKLTDSRGLELHTDELPRMLAEAEISENTLRQAVGGNINTTGYALQVLTFLSLLKKRVNEGGMPGTFTLTTRNPEGSKHKFETDVQLGGVG